ncbi:ROK family protein, partial [Verrucomicrobiota bacterium]
MPAVLANRAYGDAVRGAERKAALAVAVEREDSLVCRRDIDILAQDGSADAATLRVVDRHVKAMLWAKGGFRLYLAGPEPVCSAVSEAYRHGGAREFDADVMARAYGEPFAVEIVDERDVPLQRESASAIGGHLEGCRIGFDLGASDYKVAAVIDGRAVFSTEIPWNPSVEKNPEYHYRHIMNGLREAASHMPRVDAIGGSAAGIYIENQVKIASLFRAVPEDVFEAGVRPLFLRVQKEFGVPLVVINDGDVTALAGAMSLGRNALLGIAMGSSQAAGYLDPRGCIPGYLNELAFAPVDFSATAAVDEWSGDRGVGALYFSQQAVNKLAPAAGIAFPADMPLPERLKEVQARVDSGEEGAEKIFATIGVYLGYALPHYAEYYDFRDVLILGRVTSGRGGEIITDEARAVLSRAFPDLAEKVTVSLPDEKSKRVGQ